MVERILEERDSVYGLYIVGRGSKLECPLSTTPSDTALCGTECAWFSIDAGSAYCKDHKIGKMEIEQ